LFLLFCRYTQVLLVVHMQQLVWMLV